MRLCEHDCFALCSNCGHCDIFERFRGEGFCWLRRKYVDLLDVCDDFVCANLYRRSPILKVFRPILRIWRRLTEA